MRIALVAHDARKQELVEWCTHNAQTLSKHELFGTGTTARLLGNIPVIIPPQPGDTKDCGTVPLKVEALLSGPLGGDQQIGAMIAEGKIDCLIFFCDNLITQGHQQDVGALVRLASLYNVAFATNRTTADMIMTSPLFDNKDYKRIIPSAIEKYKNRFEEDNVTKEETSQEQEQTTKFECEVGGEPDDQIPASVKSKIAFAKAMKLNEVEIGDGEVLSDNAKDLLIDMGYTILSNGDNYKIRWVHDGESASLKW